VTDVRLDEGDGSYVVLDARVVKTTGSDFMVDAASRRKGVKPFRRALVHDEGDSLTVNYDNDYAGGLTLIGVGDIYLRAREGGLGTLSVHGSITYEAQTTNMDGHVATTTVSLDQELSALRGEIEQLKARLAALQPPQ
jgi:hypothetical protein